MLSGTDVVEVLSSLPQSGSIVRLLRNGWKPRFHSLEIICEEKRVEINFIEDIEALYELIGRFLKRERKML